MAKQTTFKVSKTGVEPISVKFDEPENIKDPRWAELGIDESGINELAVQNLVIKIQGVARTKLDEGAKAVQEAVDGYKYGQRSGGGVRKVVLSSEVVQKAAFTPEQLEALRAAGVTIPGMESESPATTPSTETSTKQQQKKAA